MALAVVGPLAVVGLAVAGLLDVVGLAVVGAVVGPGRRRRGARGRQPARRARPARRRPGGGRPRSRSSAPLEVVGLLAVVGLAVAGLLAAVGLLAVVGLAVVGAVVGPARRRRGARGRQPARRGSAWRWPACPPWFGVAVAAPLPRSGLAVAGPLAVVEARRSSGRCPWSMAAGICSWAAAVRPWSVLLSVVGVAVAGPLAVVGVLAVVEVLAVPFGTLPKGFDGAGRPRASA